MSKKDEYLTAMESQIKKWDAEVDKLRARSDQMSADARAKYDEQMRPDKPTRRQRYRRHGVSGSGDAAEVATSEGR